MPTRFAYSILFVADMPRSVAFYRDLVGLKLKTESPDWSEFETAGCTLALHKAAPVDPLSPPEKAALPAGHSHPGFQVDDIDAFAASMRAAAVPCLRDVKLEDFGMRMGCWRDPDGIPVSVFSGG